MRKKLFRTRIKFRRNGSFAESFFLVEFEDHRQRKYARKLIAAVFDKPGHVAVFCPEYPFEWCRGDYYEDALRAAIVACPEAELFNLKEYESNA